jgi:competence protein ComEC
MQIKNWLADKIWQSGVVTIVAQAGTLPLTIMLFNRFPTYFILTNIIIVPLSNLIIILGCMVPMFFPVRFLSQFLGFLLNNLTGLTEMLTARAASLPLSSIQDIGMTSVECILLSVTLFLFSHFLLKKKSYSVLYPIWFLVLFVMAGTLIDISTRSTSEVIVYNTPGSSTIGIRSGKRLALYSDTSVAGQEVKRHCATLGLKTNTSVLKNNTVCIKAGEKKILISNTLNKIILQNFAPDIVILTGLRPQIEEKSVSGQFTGTLIITSEATSGFRLPQQIDLSQADTVHSVRKSGAFIKRI